MVPIGSANKLVISKDKLGGFLATMIL